MSKKTPPKRKAGPRIEVVESQPWASEPAASFVHTATVLDRLFATVEARRHADPQDSHSARLLSRGRLKVAQKFGEEAVECLIEAVAGDAEKLIGESADMLYHLMVMWVDAGVQPAQVWAELRRREGTSGIAEKRARLDKLREPARVPGEDRPNPKETEA